jgi:hypothetical protein
MERASFTVLLILMKVPLAPRYRADVKTLSDGLLRNSENEFHMDRTQEELGTTGKQRSMSRPLTLMRPNCQYDF